jgi:hypothetical protein
LNDHATSARVTPLTTSAVKVSSNAIFIVYLETDGIAV